MISLSDVFKPNGPLDGTFKNLGSGLKSLLQIANLPHTPSDVTLQ